MIEKAKQNIKTAKLEDRVQVIQGDLCNMQDVANGSVDFVFSNYGVVSFIHTPQSMFNELFRVLKHNGKCTVMGHGYFNALYSKACNIGVSADELRDMFKDATVKWAPHVPQLRTYSLEHFEVLMKNAGFDYEKAYGVPCILQPGSEDFDPENKLQSRISKLLLDKGFFQEALAVEREINDNPSVVNRGVNIIAQGVKAVRVN